MPARLQQTERKQHRKCVEATLEDAPSRGFNQLPRKIKKKRDTENARFKPRLQNLGMWREGRRICQLAAIANAGSLGEDRIVLRLKLEIIGLRSVAHPRRLQYSRAGCYKRSHPPC